MTQQLERAHAVGRTRSGRPGLGSFAWLVWRQHSSLVVWSSVATVALCSALLFVQSGLASTQCWGPQYDGVMPGPANQCVVASLDHAMLYGWAVRLLQGVVLAPLLVGVLWGAPLVAREHERGTQDVAWGQGISPRRWLAGKLAVLALLAVGLGVPVWLCTRLVAASLLRLAPWRLGGAFGWVPFSTLSPLVVPYSLAGLAVGVLASVVLRRMILAMVVVALVCAGIGVGTAVLARPHYLPPTKAYAPISNVAVEVVPDDDNRLPVVDFGFADAAGRQVAPSAISCSPLVSEATCLRRAGITQSLTVYQPSDREAAFQWIEAGLVLLLAGFAAALALWRLRRR